MLPILLTTLYLVVWHVKLLSLNKHKAISNAAFVIFMNADFLIPIFISVFFIKWGSIEVIRAFRETPVGFMWLYYEFSGINQQ